MILTVRVTPASRANKLEKDSAGNWVLKIIAPPVDGKANKAIIEFFAEILSVPKSAIKIISGSSGRLKRIRIQANENTLMHILNRYL